MSVARRLFLLAAACLSLAAAPPRFVREGKGPGLLLVHGYGGNRDVWKGVLPQLAKDHTVLRVDLPGADGDPVPLRADGGADFEAIAAELAALVRREGLAPCLVVGHSMGGPIAVLAALKDRKAFRGVVLVDSFLCAIPAAAMEPVVAGLEKDPKATLEAFYGQVTADAAQRERVVAEALRVPVAAPQAYAKGVTREPLQGRLPQVPILQMAAGAAELRGPAWEARLASAGFKGLPDFRAVAFPGCRHWIMWDNPARFLKALRGFEQELEARAGR